MATKLYDLVESFIAQVDIWNTNRVAVEELTPSGSEGDFHRARLEKMTQSLIKTCVDLLQFATPENDAPNLRRFGEALCLRRPPTDDLIEEACGEAWHLLGAMELEESGALSETQNEVLQVLAEKETFSQGNRLNADQIAALVYPKGSGTGENLKHPLAELVSRALLFVKPFAGGGYWLTPAGRKLGEQLMKGIG